jgi:hypothetical protein
MQHCSAGLSWRVTMLGYMQLMGSCQLGLRLCLIPDAALPWLQMLVTKLVGYMQPMGSCQLALGNFA